MPLSLPRGPRHHVAWLPSLLLVAGCEVLTGLSGSRHLDTSAGGSTTVTGTGATCNPATVPTPPTSQGLGGAIEIVTAIRSIDLGETTSSAPDVGLDLDGVCTCPGPPSCAAPPWATASPCDASNGRDNAAGRAFQLINAAIQMPIINSALFSQQADSGAWSLLVRVRGYDGGPDDDQVEVDVYPTTGLGKKPAWDGSDAWPVAATALADGASLDQPLYADPAAYVRGGVLVARLPQLPVLFLGPGIHLQLDLTSVTLTGSLTLADAGEYQLTGSTLAATWKLSDLFSDLSGLRVNGNMPLCTDSGYYAIIKKQLCTEADLASGGGGPSAACDALSFGMSFIAAPAQLGAATMVAPLTNGCPAATDPKGDACGS